MSTVFDDVQSEELGDIDWSEERGRVEGAACEEESIAAETMDMRIVVGRLVTEGLDGCDHAGRAPGLVEHVLVEGPDGLGGASGECTQKTRRPEFSSTAS